jgi:predicted nucleotidyltransferase component of viral defense system
MISQAYINDWRRKAPWISEEQVEQDLVLSKAIVQIFQNPLILDSMALRGGTAFNKLFLDWNARYSEDIDLVQVKAEPIGPVIDLIRSVLDSWLGNPTRDRGEGRVTLRYRFQSESGKKMGLKVEINTREHFTVFGYETKTLKVKSPWFEGEAEVRTYSLNELLGTKLRALYQRKKGRDLFDLWRGQTSADPTKVVEAFRRYMEFGGHAVSQEEYLANVDQKMSRDIFVQDIHALLAVGVKYDPKVAYELVRRDLLSLI